MSDPALLAMLLNHPRRVHSDEETDALRRSPGAVEIPYNGVGTRFLTPDGREEFFFQALPPTGESPATHEIICPYTWDAGRKLYVRDMPS